MKNAIDLIEKVKQIREKHRGDFGNDMTGYYDSTVYDIANKLGIGNKGKMEDYNNMKQILQKQINMLLKERSGAAVSDQEFRRLMEEVPNLNMTGTQFDTALENFENSLKSTLNNKARSFGFDDSEKMTNRIQNKSSQNSQTS